MFKLRLLKQFKTKHVRIPPVTPDPSRHGIAVVALMRNEGHYIADWARFHLQAGVRTIIAYDNGSTDGTPDLLRSAVPEENLIWHPWAGAYMDDATDIVIDRQCLAYSHAVMNYGPKFARMAFIDCDEFLFPTDGHTDLMSAIDAIGPHTAIAAPWVMFGANGHQTRPDIPVWEAYTRRAASPSGVLSNLKSILDLADIAAVGVHSCITHSMGRNVATGAGHVGAPKEQAAKPVTKPLQLNHYYTRSADEFEAKIKRGPGGSADPDRYARRLRKAWNSIHDQTVEDSAILDFLERVSFTADTSAGAARGAG